MRKQKIYLDTSVIGGCFDSDFSQWSNNLMEDIKNGLFIPVLSVVVETEIEDATDIVKMKYKEIIESEAIILNVDEETINLANEYQKRHILTEKFFEDGLHIVLATINKIDILVSWNFKHIVHYDKIRLFNAVNLELGYRPD